MLTSANHEKLSCSKQKGRSLVLLINPRRWTTILLISSQRIQKHNVHVNSTEHMRHRGEMIIVEHVCPKTFDALLLSLTNHRAGSLSQNNCSTLVRVYTKLCAHISDHRAIADLCRLAFSSLSLYETLFVVFQAVAVSSTTFQEMYPLCGRIRK